MNPVSSPNPAPHTLMAIAAAQEAAKAALKARESGLQVGFKNGPHDLITQADRNSQAVLFARLPRQWADSSDIGFMGEEKINPTYVFPPKAQWRWCVDPVDGTLPFSQGTAQWSVSVGLQQRTAQDAMHPDGWASHTGVIYHASDKDTSAALQGTVYWAEKGKGAYALDLATGQQRKLDASTPAPSAPSTAIMNDNAEPDNSFTEPFRQAIKAALAARGAQPDYVRSVCHAGLECLEGRNRGVFFELGGSDWDVAALKVIAEESGARQCFGPAQNPCGANLYPVVISQDKELFDIAKQNMNPTAAAMQYAAASGRRRA